MTAVLVVLFSCGIADYSLGQAVIRGTVYTEGRPVIGANVGVAGTPRGAATDTAGFFEITDLAPGRYELVISAVGYQTVRHQVSLSSNDTAAVAVTLEETVIEGEEVVVTGTMRETYVKESPVKVTVVNTEGLERGRASSNVMDLIGSINGLSTQLNCGVCGTNAIRVNGVEGPNTAILIDGMPVMGALASVYGLNGISPSIIDRVEVIRGPQSTLYGTQALGGVVNIITKDPANTPTFSADTYVRSTREGSINMAVSPEIGRFKGFASGNLLRMQRYLDENGDGFTDVPMRSRAALFGKGSVAGPDGDRMLTLAAKLYRENRTGGTASFSDELRGSDEIYGESVYTHRSEFLADFRPPVFDHRLRLRSALTYHDQDSYYGVEHYAARQNIAYGQATWDQPLSDAFRLLVGATLRYEIYDDNTPATSGTSDRRLISGIFAQNELEVGNAILVGGLRLDHHREHGIVTAPRLSAKYSPNPRTTLRMGGGTGFRVVNVFTEDHAALSGSREIVFDESLDPERSRSVTASAEHIVRFGTSPLSVSVDGFYTHFSNKIIPDYDQDPNLIVYANLDGYSVTRGFSLGLDQNLTVLPLNYTASFTLMDVFTVADGQRAAVTYAPDYTGRFAVTYEWRDAGLEIDYTTSLVGSKRMPDNYVENFERDPWSPSYTTHDLKLTKEFTSANEPGGVGIETYVTVENIFDYTQGSPLVDAANPFSDRFDTIYTWGPILGRTFLLGARLNLR